MKTEMSKCDNCGKFKEDFSKETRWIKIYSLVNNNFNLILNVTSGRDKNGKIIDPKMDKELEIPLDFCCYDCFFKFFEKIFGVKNKKENPFDFDWNQLNNKDYLDDFFKKVKKDIIPEKVLENVENFFKSFLN